MSTKHDDILAIYMKAALQTPLLTRKEEKDLSKIIKRGRKYSKKAMEKLKCFLKSAPILSDDQQREELRKMIREVKNGAKVAEEATKKFVEANLRLVVFFAAKLCKKLHKSVELADVIQIGNMGLMRAAEFFDEKRDNRFSTFASHWIIRYLKKSKRLRSKLDFLDDIFTHGDENFHEKALEDKQAPDPSKDTEKRNDTDRVNQAVSLLDEKQRNIISALFGLNGCEPQSKRDVWRKTGLPRSHFNQVLQKALKKLGAILTE